MQKIFSWFTRKDLNVEPFYRAREVWTYTHIDPVTKRSSTRPVLIYRKASDGMFWGLPLAKATLNGRVTYVPRLRNGKKVSALSQMRTLKASRLVHRLGTAGEKEFALLHNSIIRLLAESTPIHTQKQLAYHYPRRERALPSLMPPVYILQPR